MTERAKQLLTQGVDLWVRLVNAAEVEGKAERVGIHVHGKLCYERDDQVYSVCTQDDRGHGTNSISFQLGHVKDCFRQPSGILEITLR